MKFGVCTSTSNAAALKAAGWDFVEENAQGFLQAHNNPAWTPPAAAALPVSSLNCLLPGTIKIVGPEASPDVWRPYLSTLFGRAGQAGVTKIVFGSGGSRKVPDGFDRHRAIDQIDEFLVAAGQMAAEQGVTIVIEPLNRTETNIINGVIEASQFAERATMPNVKILVDSYHSWLENESLDDVAAAMPFIQHVHLANRDGRLPPHDAPGSDYKALFRVLKQNGYDGTVAVECRDFPPAEQSQTLLRYIRDAWDNA